MLVDQLHGKTPKKDAQLSQQVLSCTAETALVEHIRHCAAQGFPLNHQDVISFAEHLAPGSKSNGKATKLGHNWLSAFLLTNLSVCSCWSCWSHCLENARVCSTDAKAISDWFQQLSDIIHEYNILETSIFNMDKTAFMFGQGGTQCILVPEGNPASRFKAQPGN